MPLTATLPRRSSRNRFKAIALAVAVVLAGNLASNCARAMGDEPATGGETLHNT